LPGVEVRKTAGRATAAPRDGSNVSAVNWAFGVAGLVAAVAGFGPPAAGFGAPGFGVADLAAALL